VKKNLLIFISLFIQFFISKTHAQEYIYPVGYFQHNGQHNVYLLYQKSIKHIELWIWDPNTKAATKALLSSFTPAGLRILPDQSGFSFIDNGRIKIKFFNKRSPKSLDIYEPIYDIGVIEWIDNDCCYFSAKENERNGIYQVNMQGELAYIVGDTHCDCMYPQKSDDQLFYIERIICNDGSRYKIIQVPYPVISSNTYTFNNTENFDERVRRLLDKNEQDLKKRSALIDSEQKEVIADFADQSLAFLHMICPTDGFVIEHPSKIDKQDKTIVLSYHQIKKVDGAWKRFYLFSFEVPLHLLLPESSSRLYESLLPLLPKHIDNIIYYVDCSKSAHYNLNVFSYDLMHGMSKKLSNAWLDGHNFFAPLLVDRAMYFGGSIESEGDEDTNRCGQLKFNDIIPSMRIIDNNLCIELPCIKNIYNYNLT
jgi:hypothetical protein